VNGRFRRSFLFLSPFFGGNYLFFHSNFEPLPFSLLKFESDIVALAPLLQLFRREVSSLGETTFFQLFRPTIASSELFDSLTHLQVSFFSNC